MKNKTENQWLSFPRPRPQAKLRLFCFPYAGGSAQIFRSWPDALPETVEVCLVHLPGRGMRIRESHFTRLLPLAHASAEAMRPYCDKPFAMFGHSMGAMISFEVARYLRSRYGIEPVQLFVSGRRAPHIPDTSPPTHDLPTDELIEELKRIKGTPREVLADAELMDIFLPILRADFEVCHTYVYSQGEPLSCPIIAFGGIEDDEETRDLIEAWREQTTGGFSLRMFQGDHFFLHSSEHTFLNVLYRELYALTQRKN